jgi:hypothetical protein
VTYLAVVFVWCAVAVSLVVVRRGRDRSILWATLLFAFSVTSNIDGLYVFADGAAGGRNLVTLAGDLCLVFGTYFLARGIVRAVLPATRRTERVSLAAAVVVAVACIVLFFQIQMSGTTTVFMVAYGSQLPAALYSLVQISYLGVSLIVAGLVMVRNFPDREDPLGARVSAAVVTAGCVVAAVLMASVYTMDLAHLAGSKEIESVGQGVYWLANPLAIMLVSGGLASLRVSGLLREAAWDKQAARMVDVLTPLHARVAERHGLPTSPSNADKLHRMLVEIRDGSLPGRAAHETLNLEELSAVRRASRLLGVPD